MDRPFRNGIAALLLVAVCAAFAPVAEDGSPCDDVTTLIVVRHADRRGSQDALSEAGGGRARELAHVAGKAGVTAIYHSDTERTRLTAEPLARELGITPVVKPALDVAGLITDVLRDHCGETVLIVGHSNTVGRIIAAAGGPELADLPETAYDNLFVVARSADGTARLLHLRFGAPSP